MILCSFQSNAMRAMSLLMIPYNTVYSFLIFSYCGGRVLSFARQPPKMRAARNGYPELADFERELDSFNH